jgi:uncharacterized protein GlcG (DUF336 family)
MQPNRPSPWSRIAIAATLLLATATVSAQMIEKKTLSLAAAKQVVAAAEAEALKNNWNVVIAIVDDGGHVMLLQRLDGTQNGSIEVAQRKARTAMNFRRSTKVFEDAIAGGRNAVLALADLGVFPLEGGLPLMHEGRIVGAIGVSGVTSQQDGIVAKAGADALAAMQ